MSLPLPIGTVLRLTEQRPATKVPSTTDPDTGRKRPARTDPYPYNRCIVSGLFDLGEAGQEAILTPLDGHAEPLVINPAMILRAGFEVDADSTRAHAAATAQAAQPTPHAGAVPPWETDPATLTETTA